MRQRCGKQTPKERYEHFLSTQQEKLRLVDALDGFFDEADTHRDAYAAYLRRRRMPAAVHLAEGGEAGKISRLVNGGILSLDDLDALLLQLQNPGSPAPWLSVLGLRERLRRDKQNNNNIGKNADAPYMLRRARRDLYFLFPYLDAALMGLRLQEDASCESVGTDGNVLYYRAAWVKECSPAVLRRILLHEIIHCLYGHLWTIGAADQEKMLAADVQTEFIIERECWRDKRLRTWLGALDMPGLWSSVYEKMQGGIWSVDKLAGKLPSLCTAQQISMLGKLDSTDDHHYWIGAQRADSEKERQLRKKWEKIALSSGQGSLAERRGIGVGSTQGDQSENIEEIEKSKYDYRTYLQQFAVSREEIEIDMDSFDYIYYHLGIEMYGNLPLIEPLEYREGHKLEELVIAIDTSGSVKLETVRRFLEETYAILDEKENFFAKMNVWIIQCDCVIEHVAQIHNKREWEAYLRELQIYGRAGTDFRPVFKYIEKQKEKGTIGALKGLLYFTDGDGAYPREAPDYQTAFVFVDKSPAMTLVPSWAKVLRVGEDIESSR